MWRWTGQEETSRRWNVHQLLFTSWPHHCWAQVLNLLSLPCSSISPRRAGLHCRYFWHMVTWGQWPKKVIMETKSCPPLLPDEEPGTSVLGCKFIAQHSYFHYAGSPGLGEWKQNTYLNCPDCPNLAATLENTLPHWLSQLSGAFLYLGAESLAYADRVVERAFQGIHEIWWASLSLSKLWALHMHSEGFHVWHICHLAQQGPSWGNDQKGKVLNGGAVL